MTVQYEKLVLQPRQVMASVLRFLELAWDDAVLRCEVRAIHQYHLGGHFNGSLGPGFISANKCTPSAATWGVGDTFNYRRLGPIVPMIKAMNHDESCSIGE